MIYLIWIGVTVLFFGVAIILFRLFLHMPSRQKDPSHEMDPEEKILHPYDN